jgi:hypothetical protein
MYRWSLLLLLFALIACSSPSKPGGSSNPTNNPSATASLEVRVSGLPAGLNPSLRIRGGSVDETFSAAKTFSALAPGTYTVSSSPIQNSSATLRYSAVEQVLTLPAGDKRIINMGHMPGYLRATTDRPDDATGYQIHVVYTVPKDGTDRQLDTNGRIHNSVSAFQTWLKAQTSGTGLRLDTAGGSLDVTFVRLTQTDAQLTATGAFVRDYIENELMGMGFTDPKKVYVVYHDGGSTYSCGGGAWPPLLFGNAGVMYLLGTPRDGSLECNLNPVGASPTQPGYIDFGMLHETFHTLGATPQCAPNHTLEGHSSDSPTDVMYSGSQDWQPTVLDIGRNDYYGHGRTDCVDLAKSVFLEPSAPGATPPPGWPWAMVSDIGCAMLGQVTAGMGDQLNLRFVNTRPETVDVYFINGAGGLTLGGEIKPFARLDFISFTDHPWAVKTKSGQCVGVYRPATFLAKQGVVLVK